MESAKKGQAMNHFQPSSSSQILASEVPGLLGFFPRVFREIWRSRTILAFSLAAVALGLQFPAANAQVINFPSGFAGSSSQIWLENAAALSGSSIQLTTLGSDHAANNAWYEQPVNVQAFTTTFTFTINCGGSVNNCVSGLGFMIISDPNVTAAGFTFSGFSGNQFSYSQCGGVYSPATGLTNCVSTNAILVKFDTLNIATGSYGASLTGYYSGGTYPEPPNNPQSDMAPSGIDLTSGDLMQATLAYNGTTLTETVTDTVTGATYTNSYTVNIPAAVAGNTGFVGFGAGTGDTATDTTDITTWTYSVETPGQAAIPTFSPAAGMYSGLQSIQLSTTSSGAVICYNTTGSPATNGSNGCASGTQHTGPVTVSSSETLYAVAGGTGYDDSPVASANYVIQSSVATPAFSPAAGNYSSAQSVAISDGTSNATIYYTTNGTTPTTSSTRYTGPIVVTSTEKLEAIATAVGATNSAVASAAYTITSLPAVSTPAFSPAAGSYNSTQSVSISDATSGAIIYYTTNGTTPTTSSTEYTGAISVSLTQTLEAIAVAAGDSNSVVASAAYTITSLPSVSTPAFSPAAGSYSSAQSVSISDATSDAIVYFTTNGSTPSTSSTEYTGPITVSSTETLEAIAVAPGDTNSAVASAVYAITPPSVSTPAFSPAPGAYASAQSVSISDGTSGATIYYTTNGSTPTTSSTAYSGPIPVSSTETLEAIAVSAGDYNSAVASAAYTINPSLPSVATPTFSPVAGAYSSAQSVSISDATSGATIYYTTNGSTPTSSSTTYSAPIAVSSTETLQAIAIASGESAIGSAAYTITSQPNFVLATSAASLTVNVGGQGTVTLTVTPQNGFDAPVILGCSGLPAGAACSFADSTVTPAGGAATTELTISANGQSSGLQLSARPFLPLTALALTVGLFGWRKRCGRHHWLLLAAAYAGLMFLFGCTATGGSGGTSSTPGGSSTTSTVMITAISGSLNGTAAIALTVK
jgi:hypothetical protein